MNFLKFYWAVVAILFTTLHSKAQASPDTLSAYPNPFATDVFIHFDLEANDTVTLTLYNVFGQTMTVIFDHTPLPTGSYEITYDGSALPIGVYLLRLERANEIFTQKLIKQGPTAIHQPVLQNQITLFPNPTSDFLNVPILGEKTILIAHQNGLVETVKTAARQISVRHLHQGIYAISVLNGNDKLVLTQKLLKIH